MRIGLTGGIATGKSTVSNLFHKLGAHIVDADLASRKVVEPGQPALDEIRNYFGEESVLENGQLNRKWLAAQIFGHSELRAKLNEIMHPKVRQYMNEQMETIESQDSSAIIIVDVPLLFEVGLYPGMTETILVYVPENVQLERLIKRDGLSETEAMERIRSQMSIEQKRKLATYIIDNSGSLAETERQVSELWHMFYMRTKGGLS